MNIMCPHIFLPLFWTAKHEEKYTLIHTLILKLNVNGIKTVVTLCKADALNTIFIFG